jgi:hypothetical protein
MIRAAFACAAHVKGCLCCGLFYFECLPSHEADIDPAIVDSPIGGLKSGDAVAGVLLRRLLATPSSGKRV